ncbi:MAG: response regulator [Lachnospiraceae bacterium]|nr:response regulator [Lachnospiraceae bacterium]
MSNHGFPNDNVRAIHLIILFGHTAFMLILAAEALYLGWEPWALPMGLIGVAACWGLHLTQQMMPEYRLWIYEIVQMLTFFYYGIHDESFYDLTPVILLVIFIYMMTGVIGHTYLAVGVYFLTALYDIIFVHGENATIDTFNLTRIFLHFFVVLIAGFVSQRSISMRRRDERQFGEQLQSLVDVNRRTEDFLTNVSHELRTPINAVTGISSVLLKSDISPKTKLGLISIQEAGHRLFDQIGDILDHTEINTGKIVISEDAYMLSSVVSDILADLKLAGVYPEIEIIFDVDVKAPTKLLGDSRKLKKIIRHLLENAIKFTKAGGARVRIETIKKQYGVNLYIEVNDTGIGIDADDLERITEHFYQTDSGRNRAAGGLGLGLSIVSGLTNAMDGFMQIASTKDIGTTVRISIPQKVADEAPCMVLDHPESLNVCCYLRPAFYANLQVWDYYGDMIASMVQGFRIPVHRVTNINELKRLAEHEQLSHLLTGWDEYEADAQFFNELSKTVSVIVAAPEGVAPTENSNIRVLRKPLSGFPIVSVLNAQTDEERDDSLMGKRMYCPGARALVVDDEVMNIVVARGIFKEYQISVESASSGLEAIEMCKNKTFDIIFMDHMMPEMDGVETVHHIRRLPLDVQPPIVALTANAVSGAREMFLSEGFDEFLPKPIESSELERILKKVLPASMVVFDDMQVNLQAAQIAQESSSYEPAGPADEDMPTESFAQGLKQLLDYLSAYEAVRAAELLITLDTRYALDEGARAKLRAIGDDIKMFDVSSAVGKTKALLEELGGAS